MPYVVGKGLAEKSLQLRMAEPNHCVIGQETEHSRKTEPLSPARSLRIIDMDRESFKSVEMMSCLCSTEEIQLSERRQELNYKSSMSLCSACRVLVQPRGLGPCELGEAKLDCE